MADDKNARDKQAHNRERRQRERDITAELERGDETEPPVDATDLEGFERKLESLDFPATAADITAAVGDHEVESAPGSYTIEALLPDTRTEVFRTPRSVRLRVRRPKIAVAMKRIIEASETLANSERDDGQREAYEKTLRELKAVDADDDDEGIQVITDWIVDQINEKETLPTSRAVRRRAAKFCRSNGYRVRDDEWLGV